MIKKPMLAATVKDLSSINFPVLATPKLDGIRCLVINGKAVSRKLKPIPNDFIRQQIEYYCPDGFDGEIVVPFKTFNEIQSMVMTETGTPHFFYAVFDYVTNISMPYEDRIKELQKVCTPSQFTYILPKLIHNAQELEEYESQTLENGFEGVMIRSPKSPYKNGRSTVKEGYLLKIKRFEDAEAVVVGFEERMHNNNVLQKDELGHAKRTSHQVNMVPMNTLGSLLVRDPVTGFQFGIGTGFTDEVRKEIWENKSTYLGRFVTYTFQPHGMKNRPRCPVFKGFRDARDM